MENFILIVHVIIALIIIVLIMIQQGKGAEMGASFGGGSSQTVFGAAGTGNLFSKLTAIFVAIFFATSFALAVIAKKSEDIGSEFISADSDVVKEAVVDGALEADVSASSAADASVLENDSGSVLEQSPATVDSADAE